MFITFASHFVLRNIPWENIISKGIEYWYKRVREETPWTMEERVLKFLRSDGCFEQDEAEFSEDICRQVFNRSAPPSDPPMNFWGFKKHFNCKGGGTIELRTTGAQNSDNLIDIRLYVSLDIPENAPLQTYFFGPFRAFYKIALKSPISNKFHIGPPPESVYLLTARGSLWRHLNATSHFDYVDVQAFEEERKKQKSTNICEEPAGTDPNQEDAPSINTPQDESLSKQETTQDKDSSEANSKIKELENALERLSCEYATLSEVFEEKNQEFRKLMRSHKFLSKYLENQKKKNANLRKRLEQAESIANANADEKYTNFCEEFDRENKELQKKLDKATEEKDRISQDLQEAQGKITSLKGKLAKASNGQPGGLLAPPSETEKFEGEIGIAIFSALHKAIEKTPSKSNSHNNRSIDMWKSIIDANPDIETAFKKYSETTDEFLNAMKSNNMERNLKLLRSLGMSYDTHTNNHWKFSFSDEDRRYHAAHASTASETANGPSNSAKDLKNAFFYPT